MFPETLTVPVVVVTLQSREFAVVVAIAIEAQVKVPVPTAIDFTLLFAVGASIDTAPVTVRLFEPLIVIVLVFPPPLMVKVLQTALLSTVTFLLSGITTS
jgi:hypothetical protein